MYFIADCPLIVKFPILNSDHDIIMAYQEYLKENNYCIIFTHGFNIKKYELLKKIVKKMFRTF